MEIIFTKKASYLIMFTLILTIIFVSANANIIDTNRAYVSLDQILKTPENPVRVDSNDNSIIDYADEALSADWENVVHRGYKCPKNEYLVGYRGNAPICRKIRITCGGSPICSLSFHASPYFDPNLVEEVRGAIDWDFEGNKEVCSLEYDPVCGVNDVTYTNACFAELENIEINYGGECEKPLERIRANYFIKDKEGSYWAGLKTGEVVKLTCLYGQCNVVYRQSVPNPTAMSFEGDLLKVGTINGDIYTINPQNNECSRINMGTSGLISSLIHDEKKGLMVMIEEAGNSRILVLGGQTLVNSGLDGHSMTSGLFDNKRTLFATYDTKIGLYNLESNSTNPYHVLDFSAGFENSSEESFQSIYYDSGNLFAIIFNGSVVKFDLTDQSHYILYDIPEDQNQMFFGLSGQGNEVYILKNDNKNYNHPQYSDSKDIIYIHHSITGNLIGNLSLPYENPDLELLKNCIN